MVRPRKWSEKEDQIVESHSVAEAIKLLKGRRSELAVRTRRYQNGIAARSYHRWSVDDDAIVKSHPVAVAYEILKRRRSRVAILNRRRVIGLAIHRNFWTKTEDRRIRKTARLPIEKAQKFFKSRSQIAILKRRSYLGCTRPHDEKFAWFSTEVRLLSRIWPTCTRSDLAAAFPRHTVIAVCAKARNLGLKKTKKFDPNDLLDQIKLRAKEDGIGLKSLAREIGRSESIFRRPRRRWNFNNIAKAVEFFGGRLMIDWQDN